jgi:hypothetical protein
VPILIFANTFAGKAQFYNGHQMSFGKNRVQYDNFYWHYYRYEKFDTYFYETGKDFSKTVALIAQQKISEYENFFGYSLQSRIIFLCYNKLSDFRQSNIGYVSTDDQTNIGGVTRVQSNKVFIYNEGTRRALEKQISASIAEVFINEILYGGSFKSKVTNSTLINLPDWYINGLISYLSEEWSPETENIIRDGFDGKKYKKVNYLNGEDARFAGHSIWYFIAETYGRDVIPNILYLTKVNKNPDSGFMYVLGSNIKDLTPAWREFYQTKFAAYKDAVQNPKKENLLIKEKKGRVLQNVKTSPDGKYITYVTNESGRYKIYLYDVQQGKKKLIRRKEHKLDQITDYSFPITAWHPNGKLFSFVVEEQGNVVMYSYFPETKELKNRNLQYFQKVLSMDYADDGYNIVMSAIINNQTDIYIFNTAAGTRDKITDDAADDLNPKFVNRSKQIIFSSNRLSDTLKFDRKQKTPTGKTYDLFLYDYEHKSPVLKNITSTPYDNEYSPLEIKSNTYLDLTDHSGIISPEVIRYDSTISYIDTINHYRYFTNKKQLSNFSRNILDYNENPPTNTLNEIVYYKTRYGLYHSDFSTETSPIDKIFKTEYKKKYNILERAADSLKMISTKTEKSIILKTDSLKKNPPKNIEHPDSVKIDISNYIFEKERKTQFYDIHPLKDTTKTKAKTDSSDIMLQHNYLTNFYIDKFVFQVDFGLLNNSYQAFTGSAFYFTPGVSLYNKIGVYDIMEDYRITGIFRGGLVNTNYDVYLSIEDLKKRLDKQYIYHRQTYEDNYTDSQGYPFIGKVYTNEAMMVLKFPFNQVASTKLTMSLRHDKAEILSQDYATLHAGNAHQFFAGLKGEYIFDNTSDLGLNLHNGTRFKLFGEFYQEVDQKYTDLIVVGGDFRFYKNLYRNMIFASRIAGSASFGKSKLIYYLGGVDGWFTFSPTKPMFDQTVNINYSENYVYQAVATNMRGFIQNARNGTQFVVINNELRLPIIRFLANRPLNSDFLNNFQVIGFADLGEAWSGLTPYSPQNAYNTETVAQGPVTVNVDKDRAPFLVGYGFGLRSRLFGYFFRLDWAWGIDKDVILPRVFYFSLDLDF